MRTRTTLLAAVALIAIGAATFWLAATTGEAGVRQVQAVLDDPAAHRAGSFTLIGVPEPERIPLTGPNGTFLAANPDRVEATRTTVRWSPDGVTTFYSTTTVTVASDASGLVWTVRNETRRLPSDPDPVVAPRTSVFRLGTAGQAFPVVGFAQDAGPAPVVWAYYDRAPENPLQPKPSQFTGHLLTALPDGTPLPAGTLVWKVDSYTAGCSSKFLPPEAAAKYNVTT